ncbi:MarR family transcriptional regulator [Ciceribacter sp. RN22]|uniref:MarR family transcriptional regulator n=1 Tax=Ciceribacter sp. RN22 TaxID=2954932 RepID=UPI002092B87D|nr:MarR family transcriptional regulator [Ciceribacter sp. RN22]MCO6180736.1 MarR family transcriptional regulator [Ciceribacter sp. RN22]
MFNGHSLAERDVQRFFGVTVPSVHHMVLTLERAQLIRRQPGIARTIELLIEPDILPRLRPSEIVKSSVQSY